MDWIALGIFGATIIFFAGIWVTVVRGLKEEVRSLDRRVEHLDQHNDFQDKQIAEAHTTSQVILTNLEYIKKSLDELKQEHKEQISSLMCAKS